MDILKAAYILARQTRPNLQEFLCVQDLIAQGVRVRSTDVIRSSLALTRFFSADSAIKKWDEIESEIAKGLDEGIQFIYPGHDDYPLEYNFIEDQPLFLSYIGTPVWKKSCNFSIVGSREPTRLSEIWCEQVLKDILTSLQICIVSGGARGIDQCAHRSAIRNQAPTIAILPSGLLNMYPATIQKWSSQILETGGALLSEYLPTAQMNKHYFQQRNRLISGISFATLVIEAKRKSGTYMTAKLTSEQNKPLFVIPSHPLDISNHGGLDLLLEGATPVTCAEDMIRYIEAELRVLNSCQIDLVGKQKLHH